MLRSFPRGRWPVLAAVADAVLIVIFAVIGRASHAEGDALTAAIATAAPFLAGAAVGWLGVLVATRRLPVRAREGVPVWLGAVVIGMLLRSATGQGTAASFVVVATVVLGAFLLGWRVLATLIGRAGPPP